jgi:hypothetical protein
MPGMNIIEIAKIKPILHITDPIALPIAISGHPLVDAIVETKNSGSVVARLTIVAPIIKFGIPVTLATHTAASTKMSPPLMIITKPTIKNKSGIIICKIFSPFSPLQVYNI